MRYPTAIATLLGFAVTAVGPGTATVAVEADAAVHGNQQGTVHGGFLAELADAAIGTAHSTLMEPGESFASIDLRTVYVRPVWRERLLASAAPAHAGLTITHYRCDIIRASDGKTVAEATSTVMTLRGDRAAGR
ncbi:PaaI family thioesterase [Glycomyces sp. NPDC047369]